MTKRITPAIFTMIIIAGIIAVATLIAFFKTTDTKQSIIETPVTDTEKIGTAKIEVEIAPDPISASLVASVDVYSADNPPQIILFKSTAIAGNRSNLYNLNDEDYQTALNSNKLIILFFTSNTCATCDQELTDIKETMVDVKHDDVVSFVVHLGDDQQSPLATQLASQFTVTNPQTKVFLRNQVKLFKISDIWSANRYLTEIYDIIPTDITPGQ